MNLQLIVNLIKKPVGSKENAGAEEEDASAGSQAKRPRQLEVFSDVRTGTVLWGKHHLVVAGTERDYTDNDEHTCYNKQHTGYSK